MAETVTIVFNDAALAQLLGSPSGAVAADLIRRGIRVERRVKEMVHTHGTGRIYRKSNPSRTHQASAPGQPPATDLGSYAASIGQQLERDVLGLVEKVGTNDQRGPWLELGTARMAARPHLRPALEAAK